MVGEVHHSPALVDGVHHTSVRNLRGQRIDLPDPRTVAGGLLERRRDDGSPHRGLLGVEIEKPLARRLPYYGRLQSIKVG